MISKEFDMQESDFPRFKSDEHKDYLMFRYVMQTIDMTLLDIDHY